MKAGLVLSVASLGIASCVSMPVVPSGPGERITIEYDPGPFCGSCDTLKIIASSDGRAIWEHGYWRGKYSDWTEERHRLPFSPVQFEKLQAMLMPYRPSGEKWFRAGGNRNEEPTCEETYTDAPERRILWESTARKDLLWVDLGCDPDKNARLFEMLQSIPSMMGLKPGFATNTWVATTRLN
jgi:hypothetical protein